MTGQRSLEPEKVWPKKGTLQWQVLDLLFSLRLTGFCRKTAVNVIECYELSARIGELKALGWDIQTRKCERHYHRQTFSEYFLPL